MSIKRSGTSLTGLNLMNSFGKLPTKIFVTAKQGSAYTAQQIAELIREKQAKKEPCVLGFATGSTTRLTTLTNSTRLANSYGLANTSAVPRLAITMCNT